MQKIKLHGFNNLTKTLSFNIYDICYTQSNQDRDNYIQYIDEVYNAKRLTEILTQVTKLIGANILNIAYQDYEPQGASVTLLVSEESESLNNPSLKSKSVVGHLDKSHITVHTYPETHPERNVSTFRADIDISTCGLISPLKALNFLIKEFESDIIILDYRVRGFTRDISGKKHFIDHELQSIQNFLMSEKKAAYDMIDVNVYHENIFHTKMMLKECKIENYLFNYGEHELNCEKINQIKRELRQELLEIFYGRNFNTMNEFLTVE